MKTYYMNKDTGKLYTDQLTAEQEAEATGKEAVILTLEPRKATLYVRGFMTDCPIRREIWLYYHTLKAEHKTSVYAEPKNAPEIYFIQKGKRTFSHYIDDTRRDNYFMLILDGWNTPEAPSMFVTTKDSDGVRVQESRYLSHDERYVFDFNRAINPALKDGAVVIADYRSDKRLFETEDEAVEYYFYKATSGEIRELLGSDFPYNNGEPTGYSKADIRRAIIKQAHGYTSEEAE